MIRPLMPIFPRETVSDTIKCIIADSHTYVSKTIIHPRNVGSHATARPPARSSSPQGNQREMSHFLAIVGACNLILLIHVVVN